MTQSFNLTTFYCGLRRKVIASKQVAAEQNEPSAKVLNVSILCHYATEKQNTYKRTEQTPCSCQKCV